MKSKKENLFIVQFIILFAVSILAVYVRALGRDVLTSDFTNCLRQWYLQIITSGPGIDSLLNYRGDYPMPYAFILYLYGKLPLPSLYSLKLTNGILDFALAIMLGRTAELLKPRKGWSFCLGYCLILLIPSIFLNSCYWGQCDALYSTLLITAFYFYLKEKYPLMLFFFGAALSFKLQAIFLLPFLLLVYWTKKRFSALWFLLIPLTMLIMNLPATLAGYSPLNTFTQYMRLTGEYPYLYYFYPNLWFFFQAGPFYMFSAGAVFLTVTALLTFVLTFVKKQVELTRDNSLPIALWIVWSCVFFLPAMHERYGFFAEMLALLLAVTNRKFILPAAGMFLCIFPKYLYALSLLPNPSWLQMLEAFVNTCIYLYFTCSLWRRLFQKRVGIGDSKC